MIGLLSDDLDLLKSISNILECNGYMVFNRVCNKMDMNIIHGQMAKNLDLKKTIHIVDNKDAMHTDQCFYALLNPINPISILDLVKQKEVYKNKYEKMIVSALLDLGVSPRSKGYLFLRDAINIYIGHSDLMIKEIYELVSDYRSTEKSNVERNIRYAIEKAFDKGRINSQEKIFGNSINPDKGKPTNMEFIARVSDFVQME